MTAFQDTRRAGRLFLILIGVYFLAQVLVRTVLGGTFEPDEAEMVLIGRGLHLAEGSQTPLYEWTQAISFWIFGVNTLGLMAVKNLWLFGAYAAVFAGLRRHVPVMLAIAGAASLLLLPNLSWEAQRSNSHTLSMVAMTCFTLWAVLRLIDHRTLGNYLLLGAMIGLGGLSKANYWVAPIALLIAMASLAELRPVLRDRRMFAVAGLALAILAGPYIKMALHPADTLADTWEFSKGELMVPALPWLNGLWRGVTETLGALLLVFIVLGLCAGLSRRFPEIGRIERLLLRAGLIGFGLAALTVILGDVAFVRARWLLPIYILLAPGLAIAVLRAAGPRALRNMLRVCALMACLILGAIVELRTGGQGSHSLDIDSLGSRIEAEFGNPPPVLIGWHYYLGNMALSHPSWHYLPPFATDDLARPPEQVLLVGVNDSPAAIRETLASYGLPAAASASVSRRLEVEVPYRFGDPAKTRKVLLLLVDLDG